MSSLKENFIKYLFFKIEKSAKPDFSEITVDELNDIIRIYQFVSNSPVDKLADLSIFTAKIKEINKYYDESTVNELYEVIAANVDKLTFTQQLNPVDKDELLSFNINLETGFTHENFQNYSEQRVLLQMISENANETYELDSKNLERVIGSLKEIYNKL